jgi:hypothetical protein
MNYLILILCVALTGCGSVSHADHHRKKGEDKFQTAIQQVLAARLDIRAVISHPPRNAEELNDIANMNPNALIFSAHDFAERLGIIPLKDCPNDFKVAFAEYVTAWNERAAESPNLLILVQPSTPSRSGTVENPDAARTEAAWDALKKVCTQYGATVE